MKQSILRPLSMLGIAVLMALPAAAQREPKEKFGHHEYKYKSDELKMKLQKDEDKFKSSTLKVKENSHERKVKALVKPMRISRTEKTIIKTGEEQVWTSRHDAPATSDEGTTSKTVSARKHSTRKYAAWKGSHKRTAARKTSNAHKYASHRKVKRHTYAAHRQMRTVTAPPQYIHDTVYVSRVDTVIRIERVNTYSGYRVPRGNFKKVKLKRDCDGNVWMKRKE